MNPERDEASTVCRPSCLNRWWRRHDRWSRGTEGVCIHCRWRALLREGQSRGGRDYLCSTYIDIAQSLDQRGLHDRRRGNDVPR